MHDSPQGPVDEVSIRDAAAAMSEFLWRFLNRAGDDIATALMDLDVSCDGHPTDPASWHDWLSSLDWVASAHAPRTGADDHAGSWRTETRELDISAVNGNDARSEMLSLSLAFLAMSEYLWRVANQRSQDAVREALRVTALATRDDDHPFWESWRECIRWVAEGNEPQTGEL